MTSSATPFEEGQYTAQRAFPASSSLRRSSLPADITHRDQLHAERTARDPTLPTGSWPPGMGRLADLENTLSGALSAGSSKEHEEEMAREETKKRRPSLFNPER